MDEKSGGVGHSQLSGNSRTFKEKVINNLWRTIIFLAVIFVCSEAYIICWFKGGLCWQGVVFQVAWLSFFLCVFGLVMNAILRVMKDD